MNKPESYPCPAHLVGFLKEQPLPAVFETPPDGWVYVGNAASKNDKSRNSIGILMMGETWTDLRHEGGWYAGAIRGLEHFAAPRHWLA